MAKHSHLTLSERIEIEKALRDRTSFSEIGASIGKDPSTISKEVRNHFIIKDGGSRCNPCLYRNICRHSRDICPACEYKWAKDCAKCSVACYKVCKDFKEEFCPRHEKPPYVCNGCEKRIGCTLRRHLYDAKAAQKEYEATRSESRQGIAVSPEELRRIDNIISPLIKQGQSIHHNQKFEKKLAPMVVVIDEFADLADQLETKKDKEAFFTPVKRIAQIGRKRGIHLVLCTQSPAATLVPSNIKSQLTGRLALRVNDANSSRMILEESGAQFLQKHGDMIYKNGSETERAQGYYISIDELDAIIDDIIHGSGV